MAVKIDIIGQRFGKLVVLKELPRPVDAEGNLLRDGKGKLVRARYLCQCDCGNTCEATSGLLRGGNKRSCGCKRQEYYENSAEQMEKMKKAREAKAQESLAKPRCPYPCASCKDSVKGMCCQDCSVNYACDNRCLNSPEKCGYKKVK